MRTTIGRFSDRSPTADGGSFVVMAEWESDDAYRGWLESSVRAELAAHIEPLLIGDVEAGQLYEDG